MSGRWALRAATLVGAVGAFILGPVAAAEAHPLGNATVNHYDGLHLYPDRITDYAVEDVAEIPTLQRKPLIDTNSNGVISTAERAAYAARQCASLAAVDRITVNGRRVPLTITTTAYTERPGAIGLKIGRLVCQLAAPAALSAHSVIGIDDEWDGAGIGWHEITAVGSGVSLDRSPFPAASISDTLLHYPNDLLSSPLQVRSGTVEASPGSGPSTYAATRVLPQAGLAARALSRLSNAFNSLVGSRHLTAGVTLLAVALSVLLGAGHAFLPGHGKTIMAAYLVGRRGRRREVLVVGATVTLTHTAGVLILGLLISVTAAFAPTAALQALAVLSGLLVTGVGATLLVSAVHRRRAADRHPAVAAPVQVPQAARVQVPMPVPALAGAVADRPDPVPPATPGRRVEHRHHHPGHDHQAVDEWGFSRAGLVGLGVAGGLVPSPSALLVLLAAVALGRTLFGLVLVLGYGVGMACALTAAGLLLVRLRDRLGRAGLGRRLSRVNRVLRLLPVLTASLVLAVGVTLTLRAVAGSI